jgi:hypothetical protein
VLILDDLLFWGPLSGVMWVLEQLRMVAEKEFTSEEPVKQAILENEMLFEEGKIDKATYEELQEQLMGALRTIRERKKAMADERAAGAGLAPPAPKGPISGKATFDIDLDFGGYGKDR